MSRQMCSYLLAKVETGLLSPLSTTKSLNTYFVQDYLYTECCSCVDMCPKPNVTLHQLSQKSNVEDLPTNSPQLFQVRSCEFVISHGSLMTISSKSIALGGHPLINPLEIIGATPFSSSDLFLVSSITYA